MAILNSGYLTSTRSDRSMDSVIGFLPYRKCFARQSQKLLPGEAGRDRPRRPAESRHRQKRQAGRPAGLRDWLLRAVADVPLYRLEDKFASLKGTECHRQRAGRWPPPRQLWLHDLP